MTQRGTGKLRAPSRHGSFPPRRVAGGEGTHFTERNPSSRLAVFITERWPPRAQKRPPESQVVVKPSAGSSSPRRWPAHHFRRGSALSFESEGL